MRRTLTSSVLLIVSATGCSVAPGGGEPDAGDPDACVPAGVEVCDGVDNDCNGWTDAALFGWNSPGSDPLTLWGQFQGGTEWLPDDDGDGY